MCRTSIERPSTIVMGWGTCCIYHCVCRIANDAGTADISAKLWTTLKPFELFVSLPITAVLVPKNSVGY